MNIINNFIINQQDNMKNFLDKIEKLEVIKLKDIILNYKCSNIFFCGIGKSENISIHISDIFKSIGLSSFKINLQNMNHGDIGMFKENDLIIFISNSGNTKELYNFIINSNLKTKKILITSNKKSYISDIVDNTFIVPFENESDLKFNLIPTNSFINFVNYFNLITNLLIDDLKFNLEKYKINHYGGNIGFKTKKIKLFINTKFNKSNKNVTIRKTINILKKYKNGIIFIDDNEKFYGIMTTQDIFNLIEKNKNLDSNICEFINTTPFIINNTELIINEVFEEIKNFTSFKFIPILENNKPIGILDNSKILNFL